MDAPPTASSWKEVLDEAEKVNEAAIARYRKCLFTAKRFRVQKEQGTGFQGDRAIATAIGADGGGELVLRTVGSPACIAKNRFNLPGEIPLSRHCPKGLLHFTGMFRQG